MKITWQDGSVRHQLNVEWWKAVRSKVSPPSQVPVVQSFHFSIICSRIFVPPFTNCGLIQG